MCRKMFVQRTPIPQKNRENVPDQTWTVHKLGSDNVNRSMWISPRRAPEKIEFEAIESFSMNWSPTSAQPKVQNRRPLPKTLSSVQPPTCSPGAPGRHNACRDVLVSVGVDLHLFMFSLLAPLVVDDCYQPCFWDVGS